MHKQEWSANSSQFGGGYTYVKSYKWRVATAKRQKEKEKGEYAHIIPLFSRGGSKSGYGKMSFEVHTRFLRVYGRHFTLFLQKMKSARNIYTLKRVR